MTSTGVEHQSWTAAGADTAAQQTYASVRAALKSLEERRGLDIFLQGSYANHTNIRADSDVDIVVMTRRTFRGSVDRLGPAEVAEYQALPPATYTADDLRTEVTAALVDYYGASRVTPRNKCVKVAKRDGYVDADVVPAIEYQWYRSPTSRRDYVEGIVIVPRSGSAIINFPKAHIRNGVAKNLACGGHYKKTVRQVKRLRNRAVSEGRLSEGAAPGYLLECMVFNAPNENFVAGDSQRVMGVVAWLKYANKASFVSCDRIHTLFGSDPGNFDVTTAQAIVEALWDAI